MTTRAILCKVFMGAALGGTAAAAAQFEIGWYVLAGGGTDGATGGSLEWAGTLGQAVAGDPTQPLVGLGCRVVAGYRVLPLCPATFGDLDLDCDVDHADLLRFLDCVSGSAVPYPAQADCPRCDADADGDVDQADFGVFQSCYAGEDTPTSCTP